MGAPPGPAEEHAGDSASRAINFERTIRELECEGDLVNVAGFTDLAAPEGSKAAERAARRKLKETPESIEARIDAEDLGEWNRAQDRAPVIRYDTSGAAKLPKARIDYRTAEGALVGVVVLVRPASGWVSRGSARCAPPELSVPADGDPPPEASGGAVVPPRDGVSERRRAKLIEEQCTGIPLGECGLSFDQDPDPNAVPAEAPPAGPGDGGPADPDDDDVATPPPATGRSRSTPSRPWPGLTAAPIGRVPGLATSPTGLEAARPPQNSTNFCARVGLSAAIDTPTRPQRTGPGRWGGQETAAGGGWVRPGAPAG